MSEGKVRLSIVWAEDARRDLRAIDKTVALELLHCLDRYIANRNGDVKKLKAHYSGFRLRCGDYRLFFDLRAETIIQITGVRNRREAYR